MTKVRNTTTHQGIEKDACKLCDEKASTVQTIKFEFLFFAFLTKTQNTLILNITNILDDSILNISSTILHFPLQL